MSKKGFLGQFFNIFNRSKNQTSEKDLSSDGQKTTFTMQELNPQMKDLLFDTMDPEQYDVKKFLESIQQYSPDLKIDMRDLPPNFQQILHKIQTQDLDDFDYADPDLDMKNVRRTRKDFNSRRDAHESKSEQKYSEAMVERRYKSADADGFEDEGTDEEDTFDEKEEDEAVIDQQDLGANINELFRHIYNEERENVEKLKQIVFPQLEAENVTVDQLIINAIESSMKIVRDQLR